MSRAVLFLAVVCVGTGTLTVASVHAQSFGASKEKVTLQRKLPAVVHLPGDTVKVTVTSADEDGALPYDFQALLETELLKDAPTLRTDDNPATQIICQITEYSHPDPIVTSRNAPGIVLGRPTLGNLTKGATKQATFTRVTGQLNLAFQAKLANGQTLISDNIKVSYDQEFDSQGNSTTHGVMGSVAGSFNRMKGQKSEDANPPTPSELRSRLILAAVQQVAEHIVNTNETVDVFLAKQAGPLEEGDKDAETGLWERALETFETAPALPKPEEDAYRLYNIGVAYEALAYQAEDEKATLKYLDQAAINYGKAIDAKPTEKYFLEPQNRIETAIAHYKELDAEVVRARARADALAAANAKPASPAAVGNAAPKGLTNDQVIAMVKAGMANDTVIQAIRAAKTTSFDLTAAGQQALTTGGVTAPVLTAMKARVARKPTTTASRPTPKPVAAQ